MTVGARVLVVEDTEHSMELMTYLLEAYGHQVFPAGSGEAGMALARSTHPDVIIMDLQLPGIDGYEALRELRTSEDTRTIPVIAVTAFAMVGDRDQALQAGFDDYVTKPIDPTTFVLTIEQRLPVRLRSGMQTPQAAKGAPSPGDRPA